MSANNVFKADLAKQWTRERIEHLSAAEIKQLRANAERLNEADLAALCGEVLKDSPRRPHAARGKAGSRTKARKLVARIKAFEARGVWLRDPLTSWGGVRKSDGTVVLALWADSIQSADGTCSYLLWAPNSGGTRAWSDKPGGQERLEHCRQAMQAGRAEGLLVYGQGFVGVLPEEKAYAVHGADAETVVSFEVEKRGDEYWAVWGKRSSARTLEQA
jgi:hypothetical protein